MALSRSKQSCEFCELDVSPEWPTDGKSPSEAFDPLHDDNDEDSSVLVLSEPEKQGYSALREVMRIRKRRGSSLGGAIHKLGNFAGAPAIADDSSCCSASKVHTPVAMPTSPAVSPSKRRSVLGLSNTGNPPETSDKDVPANINLPLKSPKTIEFIEMMDEYVSEFVRPCAKASMPVETKPVNAPGKKRKGSPVPTATTKQCAVKPLSKTPKSTSKRRVLPKPKAKTPNSNGKRPRQIQFDDEGRCDKLSATPNTKGYAKTPNAPISRQSAVLRV